MPNKQLWIRIKGKIKLVLGILIKKNPVTKKRLKSIVLYLRKSWKSIAVILPLFLISYYTIGGYVTNAINKDTSIETQLPQKGLAVIQTGADLIKREVDDNMWTANLPFIFPGFVLDNMPGFQIGILQSVKAMVNALSEVYNVEELKKAGELLDYPPNIWLLSKGENLTLAPSSGAQYRKAKKELLKFNDNFEFATSENKKALIKILNSTEKNLKTISDSLENQIREFSLNWFDFSADNVFYLNQGKLYGQYLLIKAIAQDFKPLITDAKRYEKLTSILKSMEEGILLEPLIIRNGELKSVVSPNHLLVLNNHVVKSLYYINLLKHNILADKQ